MPPPSRFVRVWRIRTFPHSPLGASPVQSVSDDAINRGMPIEAIAALLGHRSLDMTMCYAKTSNKVDERAEFVELVTAARACIAD